MIGPQTRSSFWMNSRNFSEPRGVKAMPNTGSASRVVGGQAAADGTRAPGGQSVSVAASRLLASHAAITAEYQQTRLQRAAPDPAGGATHLLNRRLRVAVTVGVR